MIQNTKQYRNACLVTMRLILCAFRLAFLSSASNFLERNTEPNLEEPNLEIRNLEERNLLENPLDFSILPDSAELRLWQAVESELLSRLLASNLTSPPVAFDDVNDFSIDLLSSDFVDVSAPFNGIL